MFRFLVVVIGLGLLGGCMTTGERAAQMQAEIDDMVAVYGPACEKLGFSPNSDPWRNCVLGLSAQKSRERYYTSPRTTSCFGHRGFYSCTGF